MNPIAVRFIFVALMVVGTPAYAADSPAPQPDPITAREIRQGYRDRVILAKPRLDRRGSVDAEETRDAVRVRRRYPRFDDLRVISLEAGDAADAAIARLRATGRYEFVERDMLRRATATPNDSRFNEQWSLNNTGTSNGIPGADIKAVPAWDVRNDASTVIVAVADSGVRLSHPDIAANLWVNAREIPGNGLDDDGNGYIDDVNGINALVPLNTLGNGDPSDDNGHGSHVAGIIGAVGNNGTGISGVAWRVKIMALKGLAANGFGSTADLVECINYAIDNGASVINASWGEAAATTGQGFSSAELTAIRRARDAGVIFVAAAGNDGHDLELSLDYPASHRLDNVVAVGNITRRDDLSGSSSNFGSGSVELYAPGTEILSLGYQADTGANAYALKSGTSMSAPHVVGALALIKAQFPTDNYRQLINRLLRAVDILPVLNGKCQTGGRLNVLRALNSADNRPFNDDFATRARLIGSNFLVRSSNAGATAEPGEPAILGNAAGASLWWEWTPTATAPVRIATTASSFNTVIAVYQGTALAGLTLVAANDDDGSLITSRLEFTAQAGVTYQIKVDGKNGETGAALIDLGVVPANDAFAAAELIKGPSLRVDGTNANSSRETGEPRILNFAGGKSLWYRWAAPATGRYQVGVTSQGFDPLLAVYSGAAGGMLANLVLLDANDNLATTGTDTGSLVTLQATAGATYFFQIDGKPAAANSPPPNGAFTLTLNDSTWQAVTGGAVTHAPAVAADRSIYVGSTDASLYALNADGSRRWNFATGGGLDTAAAAIGANGSIYVGSADGNLYAFDPASSTPRWTVKAGIGAQASNAIALAADGTIYIHTYEGKLFAFTDTGTTAVLKWTANIPGISYASTTLAPDGTIYLGSDDAASSNRLYAIDPASGATKWSMPLANAVYTAVAVDAAGNLYFGTLSDGYLYSVTPAGATRWVYRGASLGTSSSPALSPDGRTVYFGAYDSRFYAVDTATGTGRWSYLLGREVRASSPAVDADGVIYIGAYDGLLYAINPDGTLKRTWATGDWIRSSPAIAGSTLYVGSNDGRVYAFEIGVGPARGPWPQYRHNARRTGRAESEAFAVVTQPQSQTALVGQSVTLSVVVTGDGPLTYQWRKAGVAIAGATSASYTVAGVTAAAGGTYDVTIGSAQGSLTSQGATITVEALNPGRLTNLSVRTAAGTGEQTLTVGFFISGVPEKALLIRAIGPTLANFGVTGALPDPRLQLFSGTALLTANDNWASPAGGESASTIAAAFAASGAFALESTSLDAALLRPLAQGSYTAQVTGAAGTGIALAELYDTAPAAGARLVNVSARAQVGTGGGVLITGFSISGNVPKSILIRGVGPRLAVFGVTGFLANPRLDLYRGTTLVQSNDDWGATATLANAFAQVGAFALGTGTSADAALLVTLPPGNYTAQISGAGSTTGIALVEVYEMP